MRAWMAMLSSSKGKCKTPEPSVAKLISTKALHERPLANYGVGGKNVCEPSIVTKGHMLTATVAMLLDLLLSVIWKN
jgi:hypothetical protein